VANGVDQKALLADLKQQLKVLEDDLRERSALPEFDEPLRTEYRKAREAERMAATFETWREDRITQAGVAWLLGCVYVRFCEDNGLIPDPFLAGSGDALSLAEARHGDFFRANPQLNDRDWLVEAFTHLADSHPTAAGLFNRNHNPLWELTPSYEAATALLKFWRRRGPDGEIVHDFTDAEWNTRFLGDLYQDLSDHAKKTYALLQTPEFVEEFILKLTLEPALEEFGLEPTIEVHRAGGGVDRVLHGFRTIDPACGSGHFLLGIFHRVLEEWHRVAPGIDDWTLIRRSLESVHGCDKNPFAASIARFRLLMAAMHSGGATRLDSTPIFPINVAVGDSLLHGLDIKGEQTDLFTLEEAFTYRTEDVHDFIKSFDLLTPATYHVVVGNPPYITVRDPQENANYRERWSSCSGKYALTAPFAQRLFQLASRTNGGGFVGQITANSFMKREFGKKLIENFFPTVEISHLIDTSGAYIPGHGTPTVIIVGRKNHPDRGRPIRAILGIRGEPGVPPIASTGRVWKAILDQVNLNDSESIWVSSADVDRTTFSKHPWSMSGGGGSDLGKSLNERSHTRLESRIHTIGFAAVTGDDDVFMAERPRALWGNRPNLPWRPGIEGDRVRDWTSNPGMDLLYTIELNDDDRRLLEATQLWPMRAVLRNTLYFGKTKEQRGIPWSNYAFYQIDRLNSPLLISFAFVATHNHFTIERDRRIFNRSAPVVTLPEGSSEDEYVSLLTLLNSSTSCFWLKQVSHNKGSGADSKGARTTAEAWEDFYEFTGTKLQEFPLPHKYPPKQGKKLSAHAYNLADLESASTVFETPPTRGYLDDLQAKYNQTRSTIISLQEEIDWAVYHLYDLIDDFEARQVQVSEEVQPDLDLGQRAFEILMARKMKNGELETAWFDRHRSTPTTEIPKHWPETYKRVVEKRIEIIENCRDIALLERPEYKRRWATEPWEKKERKALENWLLDRCENKDLWFGLRDGLTGPRTLTISQLADELRKDADFVSVADLYAEDHLGKKDMPLAEVLEKIIATEHVPHLAAMRYKDPGLRKRAQWEETWELQREEDRTGERLDIAVPPKYTSADFRKTSYWSHRGKLDVPKERFISYVGASPDADPTLLIGWAGWNHRDQAQALIDLVNDRTSDAGWGTEKLKPLLAGIVELMPWVKQWHGEYDDEWQGNPAEEFQAYLDEQRAKHQLTIEDLQNWRPEPATRGRKKKD